MGWPGPGVWGWALQGPQPELTHARVSAVFWGAQDGGRGEVLPELCVVCTAAHSPGNKRMDTHMHTHTGLRGMGGCGAERTHRASDRPGNSSSFSVTHTVMALLRGTYTVTVTPPWVPQTHARQKVSWKRQLSPRRLSQFQAQRDSPRPNSTWAESPHQIPLVPAWFSEHQNLPHHCKVHSWLQPYTEGWSHTHTHTHTHWLDTSRDPTGPS
jgi:hypothetical protein